MRKRIVARAALACMAACALAGCAGPAYAVDDTYEIAYTGERSEFIASGSKLFSQVDNGLPGDVFRGNLVIANDSDETCEVFVHAQDVVATGPDDILDRIPFVVTAADTSAFEGVLRGAAEKEPISLGMLEPGDDMAVECTAVIPAELTNEYAGAAVGMNMAVSMAKQEAGDSIGLVQTGASVAAATPAGAGKGAGLVQAGDALFVLLLVLGALTAAGAVIWCAWKRRVRMW